MSPISANDLHELFIQKGQLTQEEAFSWFDQLEPVEMERLWGNWRGSELTSGHPMDGLLGLTGWYGKEFQDAETVHPLIFEKKTAGGLPQIPGSFRLAFPFSLSRSG